MRISPPCHRPFQGVIRPHRAVAIKPEARRTRPAPLSKKRKPSYNTLAVSLSPAMATQLPAHHRTPSSHHKKALPPHARPARPTALHKRALSHRPAKSVQLESPSRTDDDEEAMAASFLQYW